MNANGYPNLLRAILRRPWAIDSESIEWAAICEVAALRISGGRLEADEIARRLEAARDRNGPRNGSRQVSTVAVIPIYGAITPRGGMLGDSSGGTSLASFTDAFDAALADPGVDAVVLEIDSPGGSVELVQETAARIRAARGPKPIYAIANPSAQSAAYHLAAQAERLFATPSGFVGSIGVFTAHEDISRALEAEGVTVTLISSAVSPHKVEGNKFEPLGDEARVETQRIVDLFAEQFVADVAKGRGVPIETVRRSFGKGRSVPASDALAAGMVDGVDTLENVVRMAARDAATRRRDAAATAEGGGLDLAADLGAGMPFRSRVAVAVSLARGTLEHARERAEVREAEGRTLSAADRTDLRNLAASLAELGAEPVADEEPTDAPDPEPETLEDVAPGPAAFGGLRLLELALLEAEAESARIGG